MRRRLALVAGAVALLAPALAQAHLVVTGMGPIYDGISHFVLSPEDSLPVVGLAFYAGLRGPLQSRAQFAALPLAWFAGGLMMWLTGHQIPATVLPSATALILMVIGGLLAANLDLDSRFAVGLAGMLGLIRGAADLAGAPSDPASLLDLFGMCVAMAGLYALAVSVTLPLRRFWMIVAARVAGSWIAAVGLLLAGWIIRFGAKVQ